MPCMQVSIVKRLQARYTQLRPGFKKIVGVFARGVEIIQNVNVNNGNYGHNGAAGQVWTRHVGILSTICYTDPLCAGFSTDGHLFRAVHRLLSNTKIDIYLKVDQ